MASAQETAYMKNKVLIIVENLPVPFDSRVWKEALSLCANGYDVTVLCPRGKGYAAGHEVLSGIHVYRHPMPKEGNSPLGYLLEFAAHCFGSSSTPGGFIFGTVST